MKSSLRRCAAAMRSQPSDDDAVSLVRTAKGVSEESAALEVGCIFWRWQEDVDGLLVFRTVSFP
eukprot:4201264-Prymnesium_polylepis.1